MTMPVVTCLLVGALCLAITGYVAVPMVIVVACALLEFFVPNAVK